LHTVLTRTSGLSTHHPAVRLAMRERRMTPTDDNGGLVDHVRQRATT
jgi:hypothetical protein